METSTGLKERKIPWNKGKLSGQKAPLKLKEIWAIRIRLELAGRTRELALFNLAIDSKLRACGLTALKVRDVFHAERLGRRAQRSCSEKPSIPFSSNSWSTRARALRRGLQRLP